VQATYDNMAHVHVSTNTHSEYVIMIFHFNNGFVKAPQCYFIRTLPVLFVCRSRDVSGNHLELHTCSFVGMLTRILRRMGYHCGILW